MREEKMKSKTTFTITKNKIKEKKRKNREIERDAHVNLLSDGVIKQIHEFLPVKIRKKKQIQNEMSQKLPLQYFGQAFFDFRL